MDIFEINFDRLRAVFPRTTLPRERLKRIFEQTEMDWKRQTVDRGLERIKYILIGEAPPWSENDPIIFFYSQTTNSFNTRIWNGIFPNIARPYDTNTFYQKIKEEKFLLIDSLPYAMKYSSSTRKSDQYKELIDSLTAWWTDKINKNFRIENNTKIAFGFKLNAEAIIKSTKGVLKIGELTFKISESQIAADGSGFINADKLASIFGRDN